jgi:peptidoglycan/xylan/chitin deacetylase (PgdA/CDA1 family)
MKRRLKRLLFVIIRYSGLAQLLSRIRQKNSITIIYYHSPEALSFSQHLEYIKRNGYNVIPLSQAIDALINNNWNGIPEYGLVITFDDGHSSNYQLTPVLRNHNVPATIFLTAGVCGTDEPFWFLSRKFTAAEKDRLKEVSDEERRLLLAETDFIPIESVRQALSWEEIREMADCFDFQSHTILHPCLPRCSDDVSRAEIEGSRKRLLDMTGRPVYAICWPNGDYSEREIIYARKAGYLCGLTGDNGYMKPADDPFRIKRISINDTRDINEFAVRLTGLWGYIKGLRNK